jgi:hypothetical protein
MSERRTRRDLRLFLVAALAWLLVSTGCSDDSGTAPVDPAQDVGDNRDATDDTSGLDANPADAVDLDAAPDASNEDTSPIDDVDPEIPSDLGTPCDNDDDCVQGLCVPAAQGSVCSEVCGSTADCGEGWVCAPRTDDGNGQSWCWPDLVLPCSACESSADCGSASDACVELEGQTGCALDCSQRACPPGYVCAEVESVEGSTSVQCLPQIGTCSGCLDRDGDGYGIGADCLGPDCDDDNALVYPSAPELCDGIDNSCDGIVDTIVESCYTGPEGTEGVGECTGGFRTCTEGAWSECTDEVTPTAEVCDGRDNDCDGTIDGFDEACYSGPAGTDGVGVCRAGVRTCTDGSYSACTGEVLPSQEVCDGQDNDCNGQTDDYEEVCYTGPAATRGVGICQTGLRTCLPDGTGLGACEGQVLPRQEQCNNLDDNCDGTVDNFTETCYDGPDGTVGVGLCRAGTRLCTDGEWGSCQGQVLPETEVCDGRDNDCSGQADEGCECIDGTTQSCYSGPEGTAGAGICRAGTQTCSGGSWGACLGEILPAPEVCDGLDNDCNGVADDNLTRSCYDGPAGTLDVGTCSAGTQACTFGVWSSCQGQVLPSEEVCDGQDNNCDGTIDSISRSCYSGPDGTAGVGICREGSQLCSLGSWGSCSGEVLPAAAETCGNGLDDTCSGAVDDGCVASVDRAASTVTLTSQCLTAGTGARLEVVAHLVDINGNPLSGATVMMTTTAGTLSAVVANGATYHATLTAPAGVGSAQITVTANGQILTTRPTLTLAQGITDVRGGAAGCPVDGNLRVRVVDEAGQPLTGARVMVGNSPTDSLTGWFDGPPDGPNTATTNANGYAVFTDFGGVLRSSATVTAAANGYRYLTMVSVDASDFVLPIERIEPVVSRGTFTGTMSPLSAPSGDPVELGIQLPDLAIETLATFSLTELLGDNQCYAAGGLIGNTRLPSNVYIPQQCAATFIGICAQNLPRKDFRSAPIPYGPNRLMGLAGSVPGSALSGEITAALGQVTFRSLGVANVDVNAPGPTTQNISNLTNLSANATCNIANHPPASDIFCAAIGDWNSGTDANLRVGEGKLFLQGFRTVNSATQGATFSITGIPTIANSGAFTGIEYAGAAIATYLDEARAGIPAGTEKGISVILERGGTVPNASGGAMTFNNFLPIRPLTRDGRTFELAPLGAGSHPTAHYTRVAINRVISETYTACTAGDSTRATTRELWRIYVPGDVNDFTLPTLDLDWPGGELEGDLQGLFDPEATAENDRLAWQSLTVHEGLTQSFVWDRIRLRTFRSGLTHISVNSSDF